LCFRRNGRPCAAGLHSMPNLHVIGRNCVGRCQVHIHRSRFRVGGATWFHTQLETGAPVTTMQKLWPLCYSLQRLPRTADQAWTARFVMKLNLIVITNKDLYSLYLTQSDVGVYTTDLIWSGAGTHGQRSSLSAVRYLEAHTKRFSMASSMILYLWPSLAFALVVHVCTHIPR
jgi:hypothetical protein